MQELVISILLMQKVAMASVALWQEIVMGIWP